MPALDNMRIAVIGPGRVGLAAFKTAGLGVRGWAMIALSLVTSEAWREEIVHGRVRAAENMAP